VSLRSQVSEPRPLPRLGSPPLFYCHSLLPQSTSLVSFHFYLDFRVVRISCADLPFPLKKLTSSPQFDAHPFHPGQRERERELLKVFSDIHHEVQSRSKDSTVFCLGTDEICVMPKWPTLCTEFVWAERNYTELLCSDDMNLCSSGVHYIPCHALRI
jgi:hypothetical protein